MMDLDAGYGGDDIHVIAYIPLPGKEGWDIDMFSKAWRKTLPRQKDCMFVAQSLFFPCLTACCLFTGVIQTSTLKLITWNF